MYVALLLIPLATVAMSFAVAWASSRLAAAAVARVLTTLTLAVGAIAPPRAAPAQWAASPAGAYWGPPGRPRAAPAAPTMTAELGRLAADRAAPRRRSAAPYVWGGAAVGVLALGAGLAVYSRHRHVECLCNPFAFAPVVAGAAVLGAGAGYVVYRAGGR